MSLENAKTEGFVTIRYVVMSVLNKLKDYSMRDYKYLAQLAIEGFTTLNMYHLPNIEVVYLYMDDAKTVSVPDDFVDWLKVGIPMNGKMHVLTKDDSILFPRKFTDGADVGNADSSGSSENVWFFTDHFKNGQYIGGYYGAGGGLNESYYRYDQERRQFVFSGSVPRAEIALEYISSGVSLSSSTVIPRVAMLPVQAYIMWQRIEHDKRVPMNDKMRKQQLYNEEVEAARYFTSAPTIDEYRDSLYRSIKQTPKR